MINYFKSKCENFINKISILSYFCYKINKYYMMRNNNEMTQVQEEIKFTAKKPEEVTYLALKLPKKVTWSEDTVDNEHMGHKKSNIC